MTCMSQEIHPGKIFRMNFETIRLSKSCIGSLEKEAVIDVLDKEYLGMGPKVEEFEQLLSEYFGRPAVCVVNGTAALHLALQAIGVKRGDEVLVPSITYVASYQAISAAGAIPISCDIDQGTFCIDVEDAKRRITDKTVAIMPVHYAGGTGMISAYYELAHKYGLRVIEDSAHALGSSYNEKLIGSFGDIACFSFDGIKNITSGEGGCIVTEDPLVLKKIKDARLLGVENDTEARFKGQRTWDISVSEQGWRYHMSEIMAAIGIVQFNRLEEFSKSRQLLARRYNSNFEQIKRLRPMINNFQNIVPHIYVLKIDGLTDRNLLRKKMLAEGIETGIHYPPNHLLKYFSNQNNESLPVTNQYFPQLLSLPLHPELSFDDVDKVCNVLISILKDL